MSEIIAEAIGGADVLQQLIDTYTPFVDEAKIHLNDDGLGVRAVDPTTDSLDDVFCESKEESA